MSRERTGLLNVQLRKEPDKEAWQEAEKAVAQIFGVDVEDLSRREVARELAEGYIGRDACGRWRGENDD